MKPRVDHELEQYRNLLDTPKEFKDGFGWNTIAGIVFCGLVMLPGSIYLGLMTGGSLGGAAPWVTVILFAEISRRALKTMSRQELVILLHAANIMVAANAMLPGGPFGGLVFRAYLVTSEAVRDAGMTGAFPSWFAPPPDSPAILDRNFMHPDWLVPIALICCMTFIGMIKRYTLGYFFFRLTSDIEKLPFPMAPISAQGAMAMAEMDEKPATTADGKPAPPKPGETAGTKPPPSRWRIFSLGAAMGIAFGAIQVGIPAISGLLLDKPFYLIPQPWLDLTTFTEGILPATPTGLVLDLGIIFIGFVIPFWAVVGTFAAIVLTLILNPILHHAGVLTHWQPGMNTINTAFANRLDFWLSFGIGAGLGIAAVSIFSTVRDVMRKVRDRKDQEKRGFTTQDLWATPKKGRGDYPLWIALAVYSLTAIAVIVLCHKLVPQIPIVFLIIFSFLYNPFISYVNARLLGIAGQTVDIPFVRESVFLLSGAKGVDIWLAPIPIENYGGMAQSFRVNELTGVSFWSLIKADIVAVPILFLLSFFFWSFIWSSDPVPSDVYPYAQVHWEFASKNDVLVWSSTFVAPGEDPASKSLMDSQFMKAISVNFIGAGFGFTVIGFTLLSALGLPVMLIYGFVRGLGAFPHVMALEIVGALLGRFYYQKRYGSGNFLRMAPTLMAGYLTGVGLISMATIALKLIKEAVSSAPF
jgi:hypothetical protein